jgi:hypothetical protein
LTLLLEGHDTVVVELNQLPPEIESGVQQRPGYRATFRGAAP